MQNKVLLITPNLKLGGGTAKIVSLLSLVLSKKYQVFIFTIQHYKNELTYDFKGSYYSLKENYGQFRNILTNFRISTLIRPFRMYFLIKSLLPNMILSFGDDFTNINSVITKYFFRIKIPLMISIRSNKKPENKAAKLVHFLTKIFFRLKVVNKIVSVSMGLQNILERDYFINKSKIKTIYNGIDIKKIEKLKNEKLSSYGYIFEDDKIFKFITLGRLVPVKGLKYLIEAFHILNKEIPNSILFIIGEGLLKNKLKHQIKSLNLERHVILLGFKKNPYKYLANSDVFVLSSLYEGFPNVLLEALACGLPIISTDCETGPREILKEGKMGILANRMDINDLAKKMILLAKNSELLKKFREISDIRSNDFTLEKFYNEWTSLIDINLDKIQ